MEPEQRQKMEVSEKNLRMFNLKPQQVVKGLVHSRLAVYSVE